MIRSSVELVRGPAIRRVPWVGLAATATAGIALTWLMSAAQDEAGTLVVPLRIATVLVAAAASAALGDTAEELTATMPYGRGRRRALTIGLTAAAAFASWLVVVAFARSVAEPGERLGLSLLAVELAGLSAVGWSIAAALVRAGASDIETRAPLGLIVAAVLSIGHPRVVAWLWLTPDSASDPNVARRWASVAAVALAVLAWLSRDPARRLRVRRSDERLQGGRDFVR